MEIKNSNQRPASIENDHGIILYYHQQSYYSQKVLLALYEKKIKFSSYELDVTNGEQYSDWFLELNPKGELPVLQDGVLIVPESTKILNYLEENFTSENNVRLIPKIVDEHVLQRIYYFRLILDKLPIGVISMGSFMHPHLCSNPKLPFIGLVRQTLLETDEKLSDRLKNFAFDYPKLKDMLLRKANFHERKRAVISDEKEFVKLLRVIDKILQEVEDELKINDYKWLCCNDFTLADVSLGVLLQRLHLLGFDNYFWLNGVKPNIEKYFDNVKRRESFIKSLPSTMSTVKTVWLKTPRAYKCGLAVLTISSIAVAGAIIVHKQL